MSGQVESFLGPERRRRWSEDEKLQLVEEACRPGRSVSQVARQRGINASQLFAWRRQALAKGLVSDARVAPKAPPALTFAPVNVAAEPAPAKFGEDVQAGRRRKTPRGSTIIEIELQGGERVRVEVPPTPLWSHASSRR